VYGSENHGGRGWGEPGFCGVWFTNNKGQDDPEGADDIPPDTSKSGEWSGMSCWHKRVGGRKAAARDAGGVGIEQQHSGHTQWLELVTSSKPTSPIVLTFST
jgi:hypothetical protein